MADSLRTFKSICSGGLNTGSDVLTIGDSFTGSAIQLINYEPNLEGGYRKISGYSHSFGTVTGTGSVLGLFVSDGINQGVFGCRTPSSGNNYLHHWNFYHQFTVASDTNLTVGQTITERTSAGDSSTATTVTGTLISKSSNTIVVNFGRLPLAVFTNGNAISDDSFSTSTTLTSTPTVIGWTAVTTSGSPTMTGVDKVRFSELNFGTPKIVLTDGINPAATYDGSTYKQILTRLKVTLTSAVGLNFTVGEAITSVVSSSDATAATAGTVIAKGSDFLIIEVTSGTYSANNVLTGGDSSQSATASAASTNFSSPPSDPVVSESFQNHLFLAGDPNEKQNLYFSAPEDERNFSSADGAGVINVGYDIVAIKKFRNVLYIFGQNDIKRLAGNVSENFVLETVTSNLGCLAIDSVVEIGGDLIFLAPDGIRPISGTNKIGDVNLETVSKNIQSTINSVISNETLSTLSSVIIRRKSQFRYFFSASNSQGVLGALRQVGSAYGFEFSTLSGIECTCAASGYLGQDEFILHGESSGKVFRQESGTAFDTGNILSIYKTPFVYMQDPEVRKTFQSISTYMKAEGVISLSLGVSYDYDNTDILNPSDLAISNTNPAAFYTSGTNIAEYTGEDVYSGNPSPVERSTFTGSGKSVSFNYVTNDTNASHSIQGYTVTYGIGDVR